MIRRIRMMNEARPQAILIDILALNLECLECRTPVEPHWQLCSHCETRLRTRCPFCGVPLPPLGSALCGQCGLDLTILGANLAARPARFAAEDPKRVSRRRR
jgi:Double zinc ribbon